MKSKRLTEFSYVGALNFVEIVVSPIDKNLRPKRHLPYLCVRNGRLTLIVKEGVVVPPLASFH